jgi:hypothetical protein
MELTPKEKAQELVLKYLRIENTNDWWSKVPAKQCALIDIQGNIDMLETLHKPEYCTFNAYTDEQKDGYEMIEFLEQVKKEINNL